MSSLAIIGSDSLLARHLISLLFSPQSPLPHLPQDIRLWSREEIDHPSITDSLIFLHGIDRFEEAIEGAEIVINCHEFVDWSILPDESRLREENIDVPRRLLSAISPTARLIHISSTFVQSWARWPNIYGKEQRAADYATGWPFEKYCGSRVEGETVILSREGPTLVLRVPPLYGEGDECSPVTDLIKASSLFSSTIPFIGDGDGCTQFSYAGNVAGGVLRAISHCLSLSSPSPLSQSEEGSDLGRIVIIGDETLTNNAYTTILPMVQNGKLRVSMKIPFYLLFLPYFLFSFFLILISKIVDIPTKIRKEEALSRASAYYCKLDPTDIVQYSWEGH